MRKSLLLVLLVSMSFSGAAELESTISETCPAGFEPVVSMADPNASYNNIGTGEMYDYKVCVEGLTNSRVGMTCRGNTGFYMSSKSTDAHFSAVKGYNMHVCTGNMVTRVTQSCTENETALFTVSDEINGFGRHVAGLIDGYENTVCGSFAVPSNMTVKLEFNLSDSDEAYFDDQKVEDFQYSSIAEYPYLVLEGDSEVSGIVSPRFLSARRTLGETNTLSMKRNVEGSGVFIPLTRGGYEEIENDEELILNRQFLSQSRPNFGGFPSRSPVIRAVLLRSDIDLESNLTLDQGTHTVRLVKSAENQITITEE
ncbi:hypothetical protein [Candidatus Nanohalococcus occultus]|uniref:Uncharacterized protein n=1 Tax=Candidatus Nanohalococcus occultus TaxID=2978047 RepID=A0ABY8CF20_9ARCH|nr:hypothetical protein SVXNc_0811 [Candidatus Nanohaloarchaeota archaeon SVXNc]